MTLSVTHTFVSAIPDDADAGLVRPSNWNAAHTVTGTVDVADIAGTVPATAGGTGQTTYAKGDILASPGSNTLNKLAVSVTDGFVLTVDAASTNGIKWAAASTGSPAGSGTEIQYRNSTAFGAMAGTAWDNTNRSLTMTGATVTTSNPVLNMTQTWNAGAVAFTGIKLNVTNTASAAASLLLDLQVGGSTVFNVVGSTPTNNTAPMMQIGSGTTTSQGWLLGQWQSGVSGIWTTRAAPSSSNWTVLADSGTVYMNCLSSTGEYDFRAANSNIAKITAAAAGVLFKLTGGTNAEIQLGASSDVFIRRGGAAATLQFGTADAATATAQTTQVQSVVAGTSNTAGADWTFNASKGTGTGVGGNFIFQCAPAGTTGTAQNAVAQVFKITGGAAAAAAVPSIQVGSGSTTSAGLISGYSGNSGSGAIWSTAVTPSTSNFAFSAGGTFTRLHSPTVGGNVSFYNTVNEVLTVVGTAPTEIYIHQNWPIALGDETILRDVSAGVLGLGRVDAAAAVAQSIQVQSVVAGTSNTAGADWTFQGSRGTGTGIGGDIIFKTAPAGTTGTAQNAAAEVFRIKNTGGTTTTGLTSSTRFATTANGAANAGAFVLFGSSTSTHVYNNGFGTFTFSDGTNPSVSVVGNDFACRSDGRYSFSSTTSPLGSTDTFLARGGAAATLQHGAADAATAVAQTISVQSVVAGTSGVAGALWTFQGSRSTGTAAGGDIAFFLSPNPGIAAATTQNTAVEHHRLLAAGNFKFTNAANFSANGSVATVLGSLGPTGASTTVTKWLTFVDNGGTTRYVPCF